MASGFLYKQEKAPPIVSAILQERGWTEFDERKHSSQAWSLLWKTGRPKPSEFTMGLEYQRINHFPRTSLICTKDNLARGLRKMRAIYGGVYHFFPQTFILPSEYNKFVEEYLRQESIWICKPADLSRGRKIFVFKDIRDLQYDQAVIVQRYMKNPLLIGQYKWDMRVYVLVTSYHPLTVYLYREGLARFSTDKFDLTDLNNKYSHLTNSSINKFSPGLGISKDVVGAGSKWTLTQLNGYLRGMGVDIDLLWTEIKKIAVLTLLMIAPEVPECCFELFGFDILVDDCGKPWLLEVNSSPAMAVESEIDAVVKTQLLNDTFDVIAFTSPETYWVQSTQASIKSQKLANKQKYEPRFIRTSRNNEVRPAAEKVPMPVTSLVKFPPVQKRRMTERLKTRSTSRQTLRTSMETLTVTTKTDINTQEDEELDFLLSVRKNMKSIKSYNTPGGDVADLQAAAEAAEPKPMDTHLRQLVEELTRTRTPFAATEARPRTCGQYELLCPMDWVLPTQETEKTLLLLKQGRKSSRAGQITQHCLSAVISQVSHFK